MNRWIARALVVAAVLIAVGLGFIFLPGCEPVDSSSQRRPTPPQMEEELIPIVPSSSGKSFETIVEPSIPMRYKWRVARNPGDAENVCKNACEQRRMEFYATERADNQVGWRCLCGI